MDEFIKYFVINCMYDLMFDENELPNISFYFKEIEAKECINNIILNNIENSFNKMNKLYDGINNIDCNKPIMEISNYKLFFELMDKLVISLKNVYKNKYFVNYDNSIYSLQLILKYVWLRMTPDDFKNPERFLLKNVEMINNSIFDEYYNDYGVLFNINKNCRVCFKNKLSSSFDEENKEILFYLESNYNEKCYLPVLRYGIYKKNGKFICEIGSIQNKYHINNNVELINEFRKSINKGVPGYLKENLEPKKILSLLFFIKLLQDKNINNVSVPSMYVLDYDFHSKRDKVEKDLFESRWSEYNKNLFPDEYEKELIEYQKHSNKAEFISKNKTTDYIRIFERLIYYFPNIEILEYPNETSCYFNINIPDNTINTSIIKSLIKK